MEKAQDDPLYKIRHSLAHVLAQAVLEIRPKAKLAFGPPIDTGCYYDFDLESPLSDEDFADIEVGQKVAKGNPVGTMGKTGYAQGYHLHWEMRLNNIAIDPMQWTKANF